MLRRMPHDAPPPHPQMPTPHTVCQARARHVDDVAPTIVISYYLILVSALVTL